MRSLLTTASDLGQEGKLFPPSTTSSSHFLRPDTMEVNGDPLADQDFGELIAALQPDSDLDFAYQLQLQEAINASLNSDDAVPNTNTVGNHSDDVSDLDATIALLIAEDFSNTNPNPLDDGVTGPTISSFLAGENSHYEQILLDREKALVELRNTREELSRLVHDQEFAREILTIPEEEWQRIGDQIQKPFGEGSSSSSKSTTSDDGSSTFRLYIKGLVSEEIAGGEKKVLSGIGIAICDPNDSVVFEMSKGLMANENETMNVEIAELKAFIEGLDVALMLGLKGVFVFSSNSTIIRYATGEQPKPEQDNLAKLVEQVCLLVRKFTVCNAHHVEQDNVKFAVKLARDAIMAQADRLAVKGQRKGMVETCGICLEDTYVDQMLSVDSCLHRYCFSCMKKHAEVKLLQGVLLPKCPHEGCETELKMDSCKKFLSPEFVNLMDQRQKEVSIPAAEKIYCPYPRCSNLMSKSELQGLASSSCGGDSGARNCTKCLCIFCINCKVPWHSNLTCIDYKKLNPHPSAEDAKLDSLANHNLWRQCPKCSHMISLGEGCYHIYCRCGYEFCYTCGAQWVNKKATCQCPIWDERNIIYN